MKAMHGLEWSGVEQVQGADLSAHNTKHSGLIKFKEFPG